MAGGYNYNGVLDDDEVLCPSCKDCGYCGMCNGGGAVIKHPTNLPEWPDIAHRERWAIIHIMRAYIIPDGISGDEAMTRIIGLLDNPNGITFEATDEYKPKRHISYCARHNMPALPNGPCDCGVGPELELQS